jgi:A/G-specific adenine glycosylase
LFIYENTIFCRKRIEKDIWQNLFEFYLVEADKMFTAKELFESDGMVNILKDIHYEVKTISTMYKQQLTHQVITGVFYTVEVESFLELGAGFLAVDETQIRSLPLPKFIFSYLDQNQ